uniref:sphinganine-1-phosphate aldolase n=1 Tax=Albugo laibachii Nc14 TaxID=890382 RepID=F0W224_9STRA|nr:unnamed protein product [Albugo laibachii Nc14]|eukprot:CCA15103.1 unnamed protein product [Albugo laibachii Nc14]
MSANGNTECAFLQLKALESYIGGAIVTLILLYIGARCFVVPFNVDRMLCKSQNALLLAVAIYSFYFVKGQSILSHLWQLLVKELPDAEKILGNLIVVLLIFRSLGQSLDFIRKARYVSYKQLLNAFGGALIDTGKNVPWIASKLEKRMKAIEVDIQKALKKSQDEQQLPEYVELPAQGMPDDTLIKTLKRYAGNADDKWKKGLVSGAVYHGGEEHLAVLNKAFDLFAVANPLHPDLWPSVCRMEAQVIAMTTKLFNGGNVDVCGCFSSGGTESIILAAKTHREWYFHKHSIIKPEIIAAETAHAAIDKACSMLKIKLVKVPVNQVTMKMDTNAVKWNITANTIMIYASAPNFPSGIIDDVEKLSKVAKDNDVGLHVDCCLGGFILPFIKRIRPNLPKYDFVLPGVTSMSCDAHKYGYAAKGTSLVLYRNKTIRNYQYFTFPDWTGGLYVTPTIAGSRSGALSATAWTSLIRLGVTGFTKNAEGIVETAEEIKEGVKKIDGLYVLGDPQVMVIAFASHKFNILKVNDEMTKRGWSLNALQHPHSLHICVTMCHLGASKKFLKDLEEAVVNVKKDPHGAMKGGSAIYGMASSMPAGPVDDVLRIYTNLTLES